MICCVCGKESTKKYHGKWYCDKCYGKEKTKRLKEIEEERLKKESEEDK